MFIGGAQLLATATEFLNGTQLYQMDIFSDINLSLNIKVTGLFSRCNMAKICLLCGSYLSLKLIYLTGGLT